jgi:type VI secretion system protein ImpJ
MTAFKSIRKAIQWHDGMLLRPEHFQQTDRRLEQLTSLYPQTLAPYQWGLKTLMVDAVLLKTGTVRILTLEALMPDGLAVAHYADQDGPLDCHLPEIMDTLDDPSQAITVYATIPVHLPDAANINNPLQRYLSVESGPVINENTGQSVPAYPCLKVNIGLYAGQTPPSDHVALPFLKMTRDRQTFTPAGYVGPCVQLFPGHVLWAQAQDLAQNLRQRWMFLSSRVGSDQASYIAQQAGAIIQAFSSALLPLEALISLPFVHPWVLFQELTRIAGVLTTIDPFQAPPAPFMYDHGDVKTSFDNVHSYIVTLLSRIEEGYAILPFTKNDRVFSIHIPSLASQGKTLTLGARLPKGMTEKELVQWIHNAVIGSERHITTIREKRILGMERRIINDRDEMKLLPASDIVLFEIHTSDACFHDQDPLLIFNVDDTVQQRPTDLLMYVTKML